MYNRQRNIAAPLAQGFYIMGNTSKTATTATTTAHTAATAGAVVAANANHVIVWCAPVNFKKGAARARFGSLQVGATLGACRTVAHGFTAADAQWGKPRGHFLATPAGSTLHKAWQAATAKGATAKAGAAFGKLATAALAAQAATCKSGPIGTLPTVVAAQPAGAQPASA